jgi:DNA helicase-2/ATP-dependent DNA helicase PcrA
LLVLAGAGSGKTRVITRRIGYLVEQGVAPWNILAITFTNKAAGEMLQRVQAVGVARGATVCTFHALCARLLREFAEPAGLSGTFSIYDRADQLRLMKQALANLSLPTDRLRPSAVHAAISNAKNELLRPEKLAEQADGFFQRRVAKAYGEYERLLRANNALDFDDLLLKVAYLLRDRPDIRQQLAGRYQYLMIDEYQDTNHAQYLIAHGIAMDHENICVTGDPDQSIYAWRGANVRNILEFESDYPSARVIKLEQNYRSRPAILSAASRLISCNRSRKDKTLWTQREPGPDVRVLAVENGREEARWIARQAAAKARDGEDLDNLAVFYRVNALSRLVEEELIKAGVPYRIARGVEFYNRKEIKDVLAYLRLMVNPDDDLSCLRIINTPPRGIGATTIKRLTALAERKDQSLLAACGDADLKPAAAKHTARFAEIIAQLNAVAHRPVKEIIEELYDKSGMSAAYAGNDEDNRQVRANIEELISTADEFDKASGGTLSDYLYQVSLVSDVDHMEGGGGAVTLMTLHAAKGLEFPTVFMIGLEEGLLPFVRESYGPGERSDVDIEEERRLAFVGMTRAKDELVMTRVRSRQLRGRTTAQMASSFLRELDGEGVTFEETGSRRPRSSGGRGGFYAEVSQRETIERMADAVELPPPMDDGVPPEYEYLREGSRVEHPKFGRGIVQKLRQPWPQTRAEILFESCGPKTIVIAQARLEVV